MTQRRPTAAERAVLSGRILNCLKRNPVSTVKDLSLELGFSSTCILSRLHAFEEENLAFRFEPLTDGYTSVVQYWQYGPMPAEVKKLPRSLRSGLPMIGLAPEVNESKDGVRQRIVQTWAPNHVRNEFETYLFGPAQREAA
jgi:hypothetical protein